MSTIVTDDAFEAFAKQAEKEAKERSSRGSTSGTNKSYEDIHWTGLVSNQMKLIRAVGGPPDSELDTTTARTTRVSWIYGDDGKKFKMVLPERSDNPDHLVWRIISRVKATEWVDKKKVFPVQVKHPAIFNIIEKNGLDPSEGQHMFDRGWEGRQVLIMNVIDREQMEWHRENKHLLLLSRNVGEKDGRFFPEDGVPSYGFTAQLANLFKFYKSWEKYDIGIVRTGLKESPYRIINASKYFEEVPTELQSLVSSDPLTEEEASWVPYDLGKLYRPSTITKFYNRAKGKVALIDATLGTRFVRELEGLVEVEKAEFEKMYGSSASVSEDGEVLEEAKPSIVVESKPAQEAAPVRSRPVANAKSDFDTSYLKGWDLLTQEEKDGVVGIVVKDGKLVDIQYKDPNWVTLRCPDCGVPAPDFYSVCPACGIRFV